MDNIKSGNEIKRFTEGDLTSHLIKFAIPVLLSHFMMILLNTVDMIVVGQRLGEIGTSSVSIGGSVAMFLNAFIGGFSSAAQVIIAMMIGSGRHKQISKFVSTVCGFILVIAVFSIFIMLPLTDVMLDWLNTPSEAYNGSYEYARICILGIIPIYFYHIISAIFRGLGDSKHPFIFISIACGLNIVLDVVFVLWLDLGVGGAAIATVIAQLVSVVLSVIVLKKKKDAFGLTIKIKDLYSWDKAELPKFVKLAIPMAINNSAIQIAGMVINSMTNDFGVTVSAFAGIRANIATTVDLILGSVSAAGAMIIAQNIAAGKLKRVNGTLLRVGAVSLSVSALLIALFLLFPISIFGIFTKEDAVLELVYPYLPILIFSLVNAGIRPVTRALFDGSGNKRINLIVAILDAVVARIGLALIFGVLLNWGYMGYWFGTTLAELVPIFIGIIFYFISVQKNCLRAIQKRNYNMENKVIKLGVVGLKRGAYVAWTVIGDDNVVIRAIADSDPAVLKACYEDYGKNGVKDLLCFDSIEELLKSDIDAVYIATDKPLHTKHTLMALEAGKHVLSEIPVIETIEEAKILRDAVRSHPELKYMAGENCFYWAFIKAWKKMREDGKFGDILYAESEYLHASHPDEIKPYEPENHWRRYNNAITYLTHNLGPLLYIMDDYPVSVSCMTPDAARYNQYSKRDENGIAIFKTAKGAVIRIFIGFGMYVGYDHNFALYGTRGSILTDKTKPLEEATSFAKLYDVPDTFEKYFEIPVKLSENGDVYGHGGVDAKMLRDFIKCIIDDTDPPIDVDMGIRISLPGIIAAESAKRGGELMEIPDLLK